MLASDPIPTLLAEIADILRHVSYLSNRELYEKHAGMVDQIREAALSPDPAQQTQFREQIMDGGLWLVMGGIADIAFTDKERNARFIRAFYALANACESAGLGSIYSRDTSETFGKWIREGIV